MNTTLELTARSSPAANLVLAALPEAAYRRLRPQLEFVPLPSGRVLSEPGDAVTHVFFPTSGIVSLLTPLESGTSTGIALIGNEGVIGTPVILQGLSAREPLHRTVVQCAGYAYRARSDCVLKEFERDGELRHLLLRVAQALITQIAQNAACSKRHMLSERLCTWLLHALDRSPDDEIYMTQSSLSELLGVRRESISQAAAHLRSSGRIVYRRGHIHVPDRLLLERRACECYAVVSREYARLVGNLGAIGRKAPSYGSVRGVREGDWRLNVQTHRRIQQKLELTRRC
ncbi:MAG TPA: Crp/Fnr family transcriptional regulator [Gammaproteobacteria bacterium]|nr:Crp/Fnr family transcriptional regulator [Gammaproteobacteria bacterium]